LLVKPPSLKTGSPNRLVVTIGTTSPVSARAGLELVDDPLPVGAAAARRDQVVVVEGDAVRAELGQLVHRLDPGQHRPGGLAEQVPGLPTDGP
jgi:hypothetical protein